MEIRRDQELEDVLMKRNEDLLPSEAICRELALLCNRVTSALEGLGQNFIVLSNSITAKVWHELICHIDQ